MLRQSPSTGPEPFPRTVFRRTPVLIAELVVTALGIGTLIRGRLEWFGNRVVEGIVARLIGLVLLLPLPIVCAISWQRLVETARAGKPWSFEASLDQMAIEGGIFGAAIVLSMLLVICLGKPAAEQVSAEEEWKRLRQAGEVKADGGRPRDSFLPRD
jgi:hypothetical protein